MNNDKNFEQFFLLSANLWFICWTVIRKSNQCFVVQIFNPLDVYPGSSHQAVIPQHGHSNSAQQLVLRSLLYAFQNISAFSSNPLQWERLNSDYKGIGQIPGQNFSVDLIYSSFQILLKLQAFKTLNFVRCVFIEQFIRKEWRNVGKLFSDNFQPNFCVGNHRCANSYEENTDF